MLFKATNQEKKTNMLSGLQDQWILLGKRVPIL